MSQPDIPIIVPSSGRATSVLTRIAGMILYVPESEANEYRKHNTGVRVEVHADDAHNCLAEKRQDIYSRWGDVFMADDDIAAVVRLNEAGLEKATQLHSNAVHELIQRTAWQARQAGCYLFGFSHGRAAKNYRPHAPISLSSYIHASAFGLLQSDQLYFTSQVVAADSDWVNLLNARMHRKSWADLRYCFMQVKGSTYARPGGLTSRRTQQTELEDTMFLRRMFGQAVQAKPTSGAAAKTHPYNRVIVNPL